MSYKVKSLLYFTCFIAFAIMYYSIDNTPPSKPDTRTVELAKVDMDDLPTSEVAQFEGVQ